MCKTANTMLYINSNDRDASSTSSSDFTITLKHPIILQNNTSLSVTSIVCPNTIQTINTNINNVLYTELDGAHAHVQLNTCKTYDNSSLSTFASDLQDTLNIAYVPTYTPTSISGLWVLNGSTNLTVGPSSEPLKIDSCLTNIIGFTRFGIKYGDNRLFMIKW